MSYPLHVIIHHLSYPLTGSSQPIIFAGDAPDMPDVCKYSVLLFWQNGFFKSFFASLVDWSGGKKLSN